MSGRGRQGSFGSRGKGKRRFAAQGSWRTTNQPGEGDSVMWLHRPADAPIPAIKPLMSHPPSGVRHGARSKDEVHLSQLSKEFWGTRGQSTFSDSVVQGVYSVIVKTKYALRVITSLEYSQYLENYLWPHFTKERCSSAYLMSIVLVVNEKWRERVPLWDAFQQNSDSFPEFFHCLLEACLSPVDDGKLSMRERSMIVIFLVHAFNSLEIDLVREQAQRLVSLPIWEYLVPSRREDELSAVTKLRKYWNIIQKRDKQADPVTRDKLKFERSFLWSLLEQFFVILSSIPAQGSVDEDAVTFCERLLELVTDLEAQLPTRRFFNTLLDSCNFVVRCSISHLASRKPEGHLFSQLLSRLKLYSRFEINDQTGSALTDHEMTDIHYNRITSLQRAAFKLFPSLRSFSLNNVASVDTRVALTQHFSKLSHTTMQEIAAYLHLVTDHAHTTQSPDLLLEVLVSHHERRLSQLEAINALPLYPTEEILWDENIVPSEYYNGETCLALPKLNLQFLTLHDYLLRNFNLFRLESTYEIREDIEDIVSRLKPWVNTDGSTEFAGWARMALPISTFSVVEVGKPNVGENRPSRVRADVSVELMVADSVKREWEGLRKHDVCFVVTVKAQMSLYDQFDWNKPFVPQVGLAYVRGCEIEGMLDNEGRVIEEGPEPKPQLTGKSRTFRVWLDTNQYQEDMSDVVQGKEDVYETFNIFMRRKPKENNFKAVLETIRDLMNTECVVPEWLHDTFLGYGDADAANYSQLPNQITALDFKDTFLSLDHLRASFPQFSVKCSTDDTDLQVPPFKLVFPTPPKAGQKRKQPSEDQDEETTPTLLVKPYVLPNRGPYPYNQPKKNAVPFTPTQVEAIRSGMQRGLTLVVGPPGTGKTDVAVQIISNLYHNFPEQRTLLVTHSNQALNQLFEKIMCLDIEERHLLRLGHGEEELATDKDFSRFGRVNFILSLRMELLKEVERLQESLGVGGDVSYTCETAGHFFLYQIMARWEKYSSQVKALAEKPEGISAIVELFPFTKYFSNAPQPLFRGQSFSEDWDIAEGCYRHIKKIFKQLEEFRAFELLRTSRDRINYLLTREAKIIAMTCTHAALKRKDLVQLSFKYDNILMEEAAQILEVETFIPLMLQQPQDGHSRLKRVIMIGDHHQLPPVIKNMSFQKYSNMEQSMFTRFVRLGVPTIQLDGQGRARPTLCQLYKWRYKDLGDLPHVMEWPEYCVANPGLRFDYQLIDVGDFNGVGESEPTPHFYQNLGEAEFAVGLFMYMRLQGYPPDKIAILTTYNGQKHLIRDVLAKRCARNPVFGLPEKVTTVDRYQGQQNDYVILSLVRTRHVGHLRDVRRLVVAMSRARLGLYILARVGLFSSCTELQQTWKLLLQRPTCLHLVPDEFSPSTRASGEDVDPGRVLAVGSMPELAQYVYQDYHIRIDALRSKSGGTASLAPPPQQETPPTEQMEEDTTPPTDNEERQSMDMQVAESAVSETSTLQVAESAVSEESSVPVADSAVSEGSPLTVKEQSEQVVARGDEPEKETVMEQGETEEREVQEPTNEKEPSGEREADSEREPAGEREADSEREPAGEREADSEREPAGEREADSEREPAGEREADSEKEPAGERETDSEKEPAGEREADSEREVAGEKEADSEREAEPQSEEGKGLPDQMETDS